MKKILKIVCCLIFLISGSLMVFACKTDPIILQTPQNVGWTNAGDRNAETGEFENDKFLLITEQNPYADSYKFYLTDNNNYESAKYAELTSKQNYVDVTSYIDRNKKYYFYVQYIGKGRYKNSDFSEIVTLEPERRQLASPYLQMIDTTIFWGNVQNASRYEVYETITDSIGTEIQKAKLISTLNYTLQSYDFSERVKGESAPYRKFYYQVKAIGEGYFDNSNLSLKSEAYVKSIKLGTPTNLKVDFNTNILSFNKIDYASKYQIKVNRAGYEKIIYSTAENVNLAENGVDTTKFDAYSFVVKAVESGVIDFAESEKSETLYQNHTTNFEAPTNLTCVPTGKQLLISWDSTKVLEGESEIFAESYTLEIVWNLGRRIVSTNITNTQFNIPDYSEIVGDISENKTITIKVKANKKGEYIFNSNFAELEHTIVVA